MDEAKEVPEKPPTKPIPKPLWHAHEKGPIEKKRLGEALRQTRGQRTEQIGSAADRYGFRLQAKPGSKPAY